MKKTRVIAAIAAVAVAAGAASHAFALDSQGQENGGSIATANTAPNSEDDFDFTVNDDFTEITITKYKGTRKDVVIPASIQDVPVVRIGKKAFNRNKNITSIVIPEGVREIEYEDYGVFHGCDSLVSVTLPKGISIGANAFFSCKALASVTLGEDTVIGGSAFAGTAITNIVIPKGCTLGSGLFNYCKSLASVTLPEGLKIIPDDCFDRCESLTQINFPSTLKYIGSDAFNSTALTSVDLPEGLEYLGGQAFYSGSITSVSLPKSLKWVEYGTIISGDNIASITIAAGCAPKVLVGRDNGKVESVNGRNLIQGATINKTIRLQKQLADLKPAVCDVGKYDQLTDDGRELLADLQRYGFSTEEAQKIVRNFCHY